MKRAAILVFVLIMLAVLWASVAGAVCEHGSEAYDMVEYVHPTCTEPGRIVTRCRICGDTVTETVPPMGHSEITGPAKPATCTEAGHGPQVICGVCGLVITPGEVIPKLPHTPKVIEARIEPTETEDGWTEKIICSVCGTVIRERERIPAKGGFTPVPEPTVAPTGVPTGAPTAVPTAAPTAAPAPTEVPGGDIPPQSGGGASRGGRKPFSEDFPFRRLRFKRTEKVVPVIAGELFELQPEAPSSGQAGDGATGGTYRGKNTAEKTYDNEDRAPDVSVLTLGGKSIPLDFTGTLTETPMILDGSDIELNITTSLGRISVTPQGKCLVILAPYS